MRPGRRRGRARGLAALALLLPAAAIAAPPAAAGHDGPSRRFEDWLAACDNAGDCTAFGFGADDTPATLVVRQPRGAAATADLVLQPDPAQGPAALRLQAPRRGPSVTVPMQAGPGGTWHGSLSAGEVAAMLPVLRGGGRLLLLLPAGRSGARAAPPRTVPPRAVPLGTIRLAGAPAALDWIAERQRRVPDPLPRVASPAPVAAPPPAPLPVPAAIAALPAVRACRRQDDGDPAADTAVWRPGPAATLWQVACGSGNFEHEALFLLADATGGHPAVVSFTSLAQMTPRPPGILADAETAADGRTITATEPGRGLADCGDMRRYRWDGSRFRLVLARLMTACRGLAPEDWPVVYRARGE